MRYEPWPRAVLANSRAAPLPRLVLVTLAAGCAGNGDISLSETEIVHLTRLSRRTVQRAIDELIRLQELSIIHPPGGRSPAVYRITIARTDRFTPSRNGKHP